LPRFGEREVEEEVGAGLKGRAGVGFAQGELWRGFDRCVDRRAGDLAGVIARTACVRQGGAAGGPGIGELKSESAGGARLGGEGSRGEGAGRGRKIRG
jgi:hypothetical protein